MAGRDRKRARIAGRVVSAAVLAAGAALIAFMVLVLYPRSLEKALREEELAAREEAATPREGPGEKRVLESWLAGSWYPGSREELGKDIDGYLSRVEGTLPDEVRALILPHAGYRYSGQTAAFGIKTIAGRKFSRVVVMGPSHRVRMENAASVPDVTHYATPLGEVPLDLRFISELRRHAVFRNVPEAHRGEHSVQIEVPLLQRALGEFVLVPIVVGQLDLETARTMAGILSGLVDGDTLVVASSDFTHYGPNYGFIPFREEVEERIEELDLGAYERIADKSAEGFFDYVEKTEATICGRMPIGILLAMLSPAWEAHRLDYTTSGRITGDFRNSVSYLSVAFSGRWSRAKPVVPDTMEAGLTDEEQRQLLRLARGTLSSFLETGEVPSPEALGIEITPNMKATRGAFVTLNKHGRLRGCIGEIFPVRPLYRAVQLNALNAGLRDRRFPQVTAEELAELEFEISMLTPPRPVASYEEILIGTHGMVLEKRGRRAVFLPQVAPEQGWGLEETLSHLSRKAGLPEDAWQEGTSFTVFEALVFGEEEE